MDSARLLRSGRTWTNTQVLESPPSDSCSTCVSLELRYGTWAWFRAMALNTWESAERDLLMAAASISALPVTPDLATRSDPARSTSESLALVVALLIVFRVNTVT